MVFESFLVMLQGAYEQTKGIFFSIYDSSSDCPLIPTTDLIPSSELDDTEERVSRF